MSQTTDQPPTPEEPSDDSLLHRFTNVEAVFHDDVVAKPNGSIFHRPALDATVDQPAPACHARLDTADWQTTDPETVRRSGLTPCRSCYEAIFEYLACDPTSPVETRTTPIRPRKLSEQLDDEDDLFEPLELPSVSALAVLTQEVLVRGGRSKVMHAPAEDGPLCGQSGGYRRADPEVFAGHYRPCEDCFAVKTD